MTAAFEASWLFSKEDGPGCLTCRTVHYSPAPFGIGDRGGHPAERFFEPIYTEGRFWYDPDMVAGFTVSPPSSVRSGLTEGVWSIDVLVTERADGTQMRLNCRMRVSRSPDGFTYRTVSTDDPANPGLRHHLTIRKVGVESE